MKTSVVIAAAAATTVVAQAPITTDNPATTSIEATFQATKDIQGSITGVSNQNGTGVNFNVNFYDFPSSGGPYSYYIASSPVPSSNACSSLTTAFNPFSASGTCDATDPADCAVGALSAKHGSISDVNSQSSFQKFYLDLYLSTFPADEAYFGGLAIVVADKTGKPLNCATFPGKAVVGIGGSSSSSASASMATATSSIASGSSSSASSASSASAAATSSAAAVAPKVAGSGAVLVAAIAALVI